MRYQADLPLSPILYALVVAQDGRCEYSNHPMRPMPDGDGTTPTKDHIIPLCRGGSDLITNLVAACYDCNFTKDDLPLREFLASAWLRRRRSWAPPMDIPPLRDRRCPVLQVDDPLWATRL